MSSILPLIFSLLLLLACGKHSQKGSGVQGVTNTLQVQTESLMTMIMEEDLGALKKYLDSGSDINAELSSGRTLLTEACEWKKYKFIDMLIANKVDTSKKDRAGKVAEDYAFEDVKIANALHPERLIEVQKSILLAAKIDPKGEFKKKLESSPFLDFFITTEIPDQEGETFLTYLVKNNLFMSLRFLAASKVRIDVNLVNRKSESALKISRDLKLTNIEKLLITLGASE